MIDDLIPHWASALRESLMNIWDSWGIQALVVSSISFQIILTLLGNRRKQITGLIGIGMRSVLWVTYLVATEVVPYSLGKLTGLRIDSETISNIGTTDSKPAEILRKKELQALLAPLLLLQLGYPDNITAYSMEDNQLGLRQVLNMAITVAVVVGILVRCWNPTSFVILYFPMFLAGITKYAEGVWALKFALSWDTSLTRKQMAQHTMITEYLEHLPEAIKDRELLKDLQLLIKAYCRFNCLKPHLESWIYHPSFISAEPMLSIDGYSSEDAFKITEIELGFMYDVLYTKAPVIYTKLGFLVRLLSFFWLIVTVCAFRAIAMPIPSREIDKTTSYNFLFQPKLSSYTNFTFSILLLVLLLEFYQILLLPYSEWMIVKMSKWSNWSFTLPFLKFLTRFLAFRAVHKWRRWSNSLNQFNMLQYCLRDQRDCTRYITFLKFCGTYESIKKNWSASRMVVAKLPEHLKREMLEQLKIFKENRGLRPFNERGRWTIQKHGACELEWSIQEAFDKSVITWHLATDKCYHLGNDQSTDATNGPTDDPRSRSKLLSDYMVYLLHIHPNMLSTITGKIVFEHTRSEVDKILKKFNQPPRMEKDLAQSIYESLLSASSDQTTDHQQPSAMLNVSPSNSSGLGANQQLPLCRRNLKLARDIGCAEAHEIFDG